MSTTPWAARLAMVHKPSINIKLLCHAHHVHAHPRLSEHPGFLQRLAIIFHYPLRLATETQEETIFTQKEEGNGLATPYSASLPRLTSTP